VILKNAIEFRIGFNKKGVFGVVGNIVKMDLLIQLIKH